MMGVIYYVACKECKVVRDLDKFYSSDTWPCETREEAIELSERHMNRFKATLLATFMGKHKGHNVVFYNEHSECFECLDPDLDTEYTYDTDFWS